MRCMLIPQPRRPPTGAGAAPARHSWRGALTIDESYEACIHICMRTTLNLDRRLVEEAQRLTGITEKTALLRAGLEALIGQASARRLAALGGSERSIVTAPRRRPRS